MNRLDLNSRNKAVVAIADGDEYALFVGGDFLYIYALAGTLEMKVNEGADWTPFVVGTRHSGVVGRNDIGAVKFRNTSGQAATMTVIFGKGEMDITGQASIANLPAEYPLPAAQLAVITPPVAKTFNPLFANVNNNQQVIQNAIGITVLVTSGIVLANGTQLPVGLPINWNVTRGELDKIADVTFDGTTGGGGTAFISYLQPV